MTDRAEILVSVAKRIYGSAAWQRALAAELGRLHPDGTRPSLDDRLMRRWLAGERDVPDWVGTALRHLCTERQKETQVALRELEEW